MSSNSPRGPFGWLRRWVGRHRTQPAPLVGEAVTTTGARALRALEARLGADVIEAEQGGAAATRSQLAIAAGRALTGRRVAVFSPADALGSELDQMRALVERRVPLVVHVTAGGPMPPGTGHGGHLADVYAAAELGWLVAVARDAQEAIDLTPIARSLAEELLTPVVVATDGPASTAGVGRLRLPSDELLAEVVGAAHDEIEVSSEVERTLFGSTRRRVPRWLDPAAPVSIGAIRTGTDLGMSELGRRLFFGKAAEQHIEALVELVSERTGRPLSSVWTQLGKKPRVALVAHGGLLATLRGVVDRLQRGKVPVGLVGVTWLRPFDEAALRAALGGVMRVAVFEEAGDDTPLLRMVRAALAGSDVTVTEVTAGTAGALVRAGELEAVAKRLLDATDLPDELVLGLGPGTLGSDRASSSFPRRQVLLQASRRALPDLETLGTAGAKPVDLRPNGAVTLAWWGAPNEAANASLTDVAERLGERGRPEVRTRWREAAEHTWVAHMTVAGGAFADPGDETAVEVAVLAEIPDVAWLDPVAELVEGGGLVVALGEGEGADAPQPPALPAAWLDVVRSKKLRVVGAIGSEIALATATAWLLEGDDGDAADASGLQGVVALDVDDLATQGEPLHNEATVPALVRQHRVLRERYDNLSRFWGELVEPRVSGEAPQPVPDPLVTLGAVPANAASLFDRTQERASLPKLDASVCTGCGRCWVSCPDSALGPVALGTQAWVEAGLGLASEGSSDPAAAKLGRSLGPWSKRLDGKLAKGEVGALEEAARESFDWLMGKMGADDDERTAMERAFDGALEALAPLDAAVTEPLFRKPHGEQPGTGALLMVAVDPRACQGCGVCAAECLEGAIEMVPQTDEGVATARAGWQLWESLPDTPGNVVEAARACEDVGPMAGVLLSRHAGGAVAGADGAEPGSGERLAGRLVAATTEFERQRMLLGVVKQIDDVAKRLRGAIREQMSAGLGTDDLARLDDALHRARGQKVKLSELLGGMESAGDGVEVERALLTLRVEAARGLEEARWTLTEGPEGLGWSRFSVVLDRVTADSWAARFPRNPFGAPVAVALDGDAASLALGVAEGVAERWLSLMRARRVAEAALNARSAPSLTADIEAVTSLSWSDLADDERLGSPPVLVIAAAESLVHDDLGSLSRLLRSPLPLLLLLTDGRGLTDDVDPALLALSHRESFVVATSVAHGDHLFEGVSAALRTGRPALVHVYAPSPGRHGFAPAEAVERARGAVAARVHPLLRYDPTEGGVFGTRLALDGNPHPDADWVVDDEGAEVTPAGWALGEARFDEGAGDLVEASAHRWRLWQELAGVVTPFTERVRAEVTRELEAAKRKEIDALVAEYEARMAQREADRDTEQAGDLRKRLLALAGYDPNRLE